jgi:vitamin-K-epoxide reductase (warfarin-sensitive)
MRYQPPKQSSKLLVILGTIGFLLSTYGVYVEHQIALAKQRSVTYKAGCDFEDLNISCSRALSSKAANLLSYLEILPQDHILDLSNVEAGLLFYGATMICPFFTLLDVPQRAMAMLLAASFTFIVSLYLAFVMIFVLNDVCILCLSMDFVNLVLFLVSLQDAMRISSLEIMDLKKKTMPSSSPNELTTNHNNESTANNSNDDDKDKHE